MYRANLACNLPSLSIFKAGSIFGVRNPMNKLSKYIPNAYVTMYHP